MKKKLLILVLVLGMMGSVAGQNAHYRLNETSGTTVFDFSGNNNDASTINGPTQGVSGAPANLGDSLAYDLEADNVEHIEGPDMPVSDDFTLTAWVNLETVGSHENIIWSEHDGNGGVIWSDRGKDGDLGLWIDGTELDTGPSIPQGEWVFFAVSYDDSSDSVTFYKNTSKTTGTLSVDYNGISNNWGVGNHMISSPGNGGNLDGKVDDPQVYNTLLSDSEVNNVMNCGSTVCNNPPTFNSVGSTPENWTNGSSPDFELDVTDDSSVNSVQADVQEGGSTIKSGVSLSEDADGNWTVTDLFQVDQVNTWYNVTFTAEDDDGATSTKEVSQYVSDRSPTFKVNSPENKTYGTQSLSWKLNETGDGDDVLNEELDVRIYEDGVQVGTDTITEGSTSTGSWTSSDGSHTFKAELVESDGDTTSKTVGFTVDTGFGDINISNPPENGTTKDLSEIWLNYTITNEPNLDTSSCQYSKDGGTNISISSCSNTTFQLGSIGNHNITLWAKDTLGNLGKETNSWFADQRNYVRLEDSVTGNSISDFEVTFSNGTSTSGGSTSSGEFTFLTSNTPTGNTTMNLKADSYESRDVSLNVTDSFSLDQTYQMTRSDLQVTVLDEQTQKNIEYNLTFSNSTTVHEASSYAENSKSSTLDCGASCTASENWQFNETVTTDQVSLSTGDLQYVNSIDMEAHFIDGSTETVTEGSPTSSNTESYSFSTDKVVDYVKIKCDIGDGGANPEYCEINGVEVSDSDKSGFAGEHKFLTNYGYPSGQVKVRTENTDYRPRTYFLNFDGFSSITQNAYLLKRGEGIFVSIEVYDNTETAIQGAQVTVQKSFSGTWKTVGQELSSSSGGTSFYTDPDINYKVIASHPDYSTFEGTFSPTNYQYDALKIQLGSSNNYNFTTRWDSIDYKLTPEDRYLNKSEVTSLNWTVSDSLGKLSEFGLRLKHRNGTLIQDQVITTSPSGGEVSIDINGSEWPRDQEFLVEGYVVSDGNEYRIEKIYEFERSWTAGIFSFDKILDTNGDGLNDTAKGLFALIFTAVIGSSLGKRFDRDGGGFIAVMVLGAFTLGKWFPVEIWLLTFLGLLGIYLYR